MKRTFVLGGGHGYSEGMPPSKVSSTSWTDYSQDDYNAGGNGNQFSMYGQLESGMSFEGDSFQTGAGEFSGALAYQQDYTVGHGDRAYSYGHTHGSQLGGEYDQSGGYGYNQQSDWNYKETRQDYSWGGQQSFGGQQLFDSQQSFGGGSGQRGRGRGQNRGQGQVQSNWGQSRGQGQQRGRGRGGQTTSRGGANQAFRGRGRGQNQDGGRGQGRGNRGQGRGQGSNNPAPAQKPRGRGRGSSFGGGNNSGGGNNEGCGNYQQSQVGNRGRGRGASASQVKNVSESIMGMMAGGTGQRGGKGRGAARGRGAASTSKPGSLMDLVDTANERKFGKTFNPGANEEVVRLGQFLEFFGACPDRVNGIQTISNALTASRLNLQVQFEAEELMFITKPLFTGVLSLGNFFLTRGLGLSKKAVKHDCFQRAVEMLRVMSVDDIQGLEDCGKETLMAEVKRQSEEDFEAFKTFIMQKQATEVESTVKIHKAAVAESQVAERNFPLADKMMMLKLELEKSGMEEHGVPVASRFDVLCFKVGISVAALFRAVSLAQARPFNTQPYKGDPDIELVCEIYYDGVQVGQGTGRPRKNAQTLAYKNIHERLQAETIAQIIEGPKIPTQPEALADYFEVIYKGAKPQEGNNHQRLFSLKAYPPDLSQSVDDMVVIETEGDSMEDNAYKILEFSASKCAMLLEWKQLDKGNANSGFRCEMTVNKKKTAVGFGPSKPKARNAAAAMLLTEMYLSQDVISFHPQDDFTKAVSVTAIRERAEALRMEGAPRVDRVECAWPNSQAAAATEQGVNGEDMVAAGNSWIADPLRPWLEDTILEMMEGHCRKVTLEELIFGPEISSALRKFCYAAARHCFLIASTRNDATKGTFITFHARGVTPQEMVKILHLCKSKSGRYSLMRSNKPMSAVQQAQFARSFPDVWPARARVALAAEKQKRELAEAEKQQKMKVKQDQEMQVS